jgi:type 1 glutamine amidotransferase
MGRNTAGGSASPPHCGFNPVCPMTPPLPSRRTFLSQAAALGAVCAVAGRTAAASPAASTSAAGSLPSLKGRKVLVVWGGWKGHEPEKCVGLYVPWMEAEGATVQVHDTLEVYADEALMGSLDLIVQCFTQGEIAANQEDGLLKAVRAGCGLAGWHGGLCDSFRKNVAYQFMTGGQWVAHPGGIIDYTVQVTDPHDPVTHGLGQFAMKSEQYFMLVDPNVKVLATTTFTGQHAPWIDGCVMPVVWKKTYGQGRVFYNSLGHVAADFNVREAAEIMRRGLRWASASKYESAEPWVSPVYRQG